MPEIPESIRFEHGTIDKMSFEYLDEINIAVRLPEKRGRSMTRTWHAALN